MLFQAEPTCFSLFRTPVCQDLLTDPMAEASPSDPLIPGNSREPSGSHCDMGIPPDPKGQAPFDFGAKDHPKFCLNLAPLTAEPHKADPQPAMV
jgi:hypothetical protein